MIPFTHSRTCCALILIEVIKNKKSLTQALTQGLKQFKEIKQHSLIQEICYGVMRWYFSLDCIAKQLLEKPLRQKDTDIYLLILIGLYQLEYMRIPSHAAIKETVDACFILKKRWASALVNASLRAFQRHRETLNGNLQDNEVYRHAHPDWLIDLIKQAWPQTWQKILEANNTYPPMTLRINPLHISRENYLNKLIENNIQASTCLYAPYAIQLHKPLPVTCLPEFTQGFASVQDEASQLVATLLELKPHSRVLDACAAPGGKTAALYEYEPSIDIIAIDNDASRLIRIKENQERCHFKAKVIEGDACYPQNWWDNIPFDRILLDVPCTAIGVIRRHPDIKYLRQSNDINTITQQQYHILKSIWPLLKKNGILLYTTCSILPQENTQQLQRFLAETLDARHVPLNSDWGHLQTIGQQILPGETTMDGFYYGKIVKI